MQSQPLDSSSPDLGLSNQRSVIAKSVSNQVVPVGANRTYDQLCDPGEGSPKAPMSPSLHYQSIQMAPSPGSTSPPLFISSPVSAHSTMLANANYDLYYGYELLKSSKRKPIPVPSESKDDAYWERRRRNNESAKRSREIRRIKEVQTNKRIMHLEQENVKLQAEIGFLREEVKRLRENEMSHGFPYLVRRYK